jgi:serine kinase of HPr protein (carbohydrate metabolism regulator)
MLIHATSIALEGRAVLLTGASGIGKSDLALRLIMEQGASLISDDQTVLSVQGNQLIASPPATIAGIIEVRHVGLLRMPYVSAVPVALVVELMPLSADVPRLPDKNSGTISLLEYPVRQLNLPATAASTAAKIRAALLFSDVTEMSIQDN